MIVSLGNIYYKSVINLFSQILNTAIEISIRKRKGINLNLKMITIFIKLFD